MVVFGAGASYDSISRYWSSEPLLTEGVEVTFGHRRLRIPAEEAKTPLTADIVRPSTLSHQLLDTYPQARPVAAELRRWIRPHGLASNEGPAKTISLESALQDYLDEADGDHDAAVHILAFQFYLRDLLRMSDEATRKATASTTNQVALLNAVIRSARRTDRRIMLVSFNYDRLVEDALQSILRRQFNSFPDYLEDANLRLIKPHGSIDWHYTAQGVQPSGSTEIDSARSTIDLVAGGGHFTIQDFNGLRHTGLRPRNPCVPALALPVVSKTGLVCPEKQLEVLRELQGTVTQVLTVGWRAAEDHFMEPHMRAALGGRGCSLMVCTGGNSGQSEADGVVERIGSIAEVTDAVTETDGFSKLLEGSTVDDWLDSPS